MSDLAFKTAPTRQKSSSRRMRGALAFLALLGVVLAAMLWTLDLPRGW